LLCAQNQKSRFKERKINKVIEKVAIWRRLYTGYHDEEGRLLNMTLEKAAEKVEISKKTLDDYLLQIRQALAPLTKRSGKKYGFDFNNHLNDKIGILRDFVKKNKIQKVKLKDSSDFQN